MPELSVRLFGSFQVNLDGQPKRNFRTNKVKALLAFLITEQAFSDWPVEHQRRDLLALLWPELPDLNARRNLRQVIYHLKRAIPQVNGGPGQPLPFLLAGRQSISVNHEAAYDSDVSGFLKLVLARQRHGPHGIVNCADCFANLDEACKLYRGDFLSDFSLPQNNPFEEWALFRQEQLRQLALTALEELTAAALEAGDYRYAQSAAGRQLQIDNFRDKAYQQLIQAQACAGDRGTALATYKRYCESLERELGLAPAAELKATMRAIRTGDLQCQSPATLWRLMRAQSGQRSTR